MSDSAIAPFRRQDGSASDIGPQGGQRLPKQFELRGFEGSLQDYIDALYAQYRELLDDPDVRPWGKPLVAWGEATPDGRDETFWHLITKGPNDARTLDLERCARLPWTVDIVRRFARDEIRVCWWRERRRGKGGKVMVADVNFKHVVSLRESGAAVWLGTAYPTGGKSRRNHMRRAAESWLCGRSGKWKDRHAVGELITT